MKRKATLADVAAVAGVSKMTASRALRRTGDVSKTSTEKVTRAARDIGYVGNHLATSLSSQRSDLIGVVVPGLTNSVYAEVLSGIAQAIDGKGIQPVFGITDYDADKEYDVIRNMLSWRPAGLIVTGLDQPEHTLRLLKEADIPIVQIMDLDGDPVDRCVGLSHNAAGRAMAMVVVAKGRSRIGYVGCGLQKDMRAAKRMQGFMDGLAERGTRPATTLMSEEMSSTKAGRLMTAQLLADHPDLDCIYYSNDDLAAGGLFHCLASGIQVPGRVLLAGFNGLDFIESLPVQITTSVTPRHEIGETAAKMVLAASQNHPDQQKRIAFTPRIIAAT